MRLRALVLTALAVFAFASAQAPHVIANYAFEELPATAIPCSETSMAEYTGQAHFAYCGVIDDAVTDANKAIVESRLIGFHGYRTVQAWTNEVNEGGIEVWGSSYHNATHAAAAFLVVDKPNHRTVTILAFNELR